MRLSCDDALNCFSQLMKTEWSKLTESDTRSKIIDPIFTKCLNWQENDIVREEHDTSGYVDYIFRLRDMNSFVIEAKKKGILFNLPISYNLKRRYEIGGAISRDETVKKALIQAQRYCISHGCRYGVITNGDQFIVFEAMKAGGEWEKGTCIIFYNLDDICKHFNEFWNILSKDAVEKNSFAEIVSKDIEELMFCRPIDGVIIKNIRQPRNDLYRYIMPIADYAFQEITDPDRLDMLKKCYVYEEEFDEVDKLLKSEFSRTNPMLYTENDIKRIVQSQKTSGVFQKDFYKSIENLTKEFGEPILLLLLGGVGAGKTTFIHRFFNTVLSPQEKEKKLWFYIDWRDGPTNPNEIKQYILNCIVKEFYSKYPAIIGLLKTEYAISELKETVDSLKQAFAILKALGFVLSIVVDNVDQHKSSSPTFHELVFIETHSLTNELRTITLMTLREESYYRSSIAGAFDAYYVQKYIINPPDFIKLILHRLNYVMEKMSLPEPEFKKLVGTNVDFGSKYKTIREFFQILRDSFSMPKGDVSEFMAKISAGNMRRTLELFGNFLMSGNTKIDEMLDLHRKTGTYYIARHQLVKSIMLGDYKYYSEEPSYIMNLFDFNTEYTHDHMLNLKILRFAEEHLSNVTVTGRGFVEINQLMREASNLRISPKAVEDALLRLAKKNLIVFDTRAREDFESASYFRITECGSYFLNTLSKSFVYLDCVWMDTPISDTDLVQDLRKVIDGTNLALRFDRTRMFLSYLNKMEERERVQNPQQQFSPIGKSTFVKGISSGFEKEREIILRSYNVRQRYT